MAKIEGLFQATLAEAPDRDSAVAVSARHPEQVRDTRPLPPRGAGVALKRLMPPALESSDSDLALRPARPPATAITPGRILAVALALAWSASTGTACGEEDTADGSQDQGSDGEDGGDADGVDCDAPTVQDGAACPREGAVCEWADDCGGETLECLDGLWVQTEATGCFADPVPCSASPSSGDACDEDDPCDPDGDCRDVLECAGYTWVAREVCTEEYCRAAAPAAGKACDEEERGCWIDHRCGDRVFLCIEGWWHFVGGGICESPVPCVEVPVVNDACDAEGEVCEPLVDDLPALVCDGATWQRG